MRLLTRFLTILMVVGLLLGVFNVVVLAQSDGDAQIRFMHAIPAASAIDVYTDGQLTISGLAYGQASSYIDIPAGDHQLSVTPTGLTTTLWQQGVAIGAGRAQTLIAAPTNPLGFLVFQEDLSPVELGNTRLLVVHAIPGGPVLDVVQARGERIIQGLQPEQPFGPFDVPAFVYELAVTASGGSLEDALLPAQPYTLDGGTSYMMVVYGPANSPQTALLATATGLSADGGLVRLAHGVAGAPAVDIYLNDTLIAPALAFGATTPHLALPAGDYTASFQANGQELVSATLNIQPGGAGTVIALGTPDEVSVGLFPDEISAVSSGMATLNLVNAIPGATVSVTLSDGTSLADGLAFNEASGNVSIEPARLGATVMLSMGDQQGSVDIPAQTFYGGVYYNVIALSGTAFTPPSVIFVPTSLSQGIASAPGAPTLTVASGGDTEPVIPTLVPTEAPAPTEVVSQPTLPPVPTQAAPALPEGPTGRVMLDPDANLQLRQYPRADALSLGGAPSNTVLAIQGRVGPAEYQDWEVPDPELEEFEDPALALVDEDADLNPEETWLFVTYTTPDGGTITAWVNALYLEVRNERSLLMKLRDLPTVPINRYGEASGTAITPPPVPVNRATVVVFNIAPGANLNVRRTPEVEGERLAGVPSGTVMDILGMGESGDWAYVRYTPSQGGEITGWVSTGFIEYYYNDRKVDLQELFDREMIDTIDDNMETFDSQYRGRVGGGAEIAPLPTIDPVKDQFVAQPLIATDANLNLRRTASESAEVIGKIPAGTQLIIDARTDDGEWLQTTFEGQSGWIAAAFVQLTYNGKLAEVTDVPILVTEEPEPTDAPDQ